jgi:uncharacterized membrane protein HdeD (DUF308 family)
MNQEATVNRKLTYWWIPLLFGIIFIVTGVWIFNAPAESFERITKLLGVIILISGTSEVFLTIGRRRGISGWGFQLSGGLIDMVIGIILIVNPSILLKIITLFVAAWLIISSITIIMRASEARQKEHAYWKWELILGIFLLLLAILLLWHPMILGFTIGIWTALAFIILGIFRIVLTIRLKIMSGRTLQKQDPN